MVILAHLSFSVVQPFSFCLTATLTPSLTQRTQADRGATAYAACMAAPDTTVFVAIDSGGDFVGYVLVGPNTLPLPAEQDRLPHDGEIRQLYLRTAVQRSGLGGRLLARAITHWREHHGSNAPLYVSVFDEPTHRLLPFYQRNGFAIIGQHQLAPVGEFVCTDFIMVSTVPANSAIP
jgi:GNAT superfamily N-acetyltransferase